MKHPGSCSEFSAQRNAELLRAYRNVLSRKSYFNVNSDFNMVVNEPCSRFWISEERAMIVVSAMLRGQPILFSMRPTKRDMFIEIHYRVSMLRKEDPGMSLFDAVFDVVNSPAPKFYMEPPYARNIICNIKKARNTK